MIARAKSSYRHLSQTGDKRRTPYHGADAQARMKPRLVSSTVSCFEIDKIRAQPDRRQVIADHARGQFSAFQRHQHAAARERIDERRGIPD
jgi:hypothetical protein